MSSATRLPRPLPSRRPKPAGSSRSIVPALAAALVGGALVSPVGAAETCFRQCLAGKVTSSAITDDRIRFEMKQCRETCDAGRLASLDPVLRRKLETCRPERLPVEEFRQVRGASPSYVVQSNAFTWDVFNPLKDKAIREIEIVSQTMDLRDTVMTAPGTVLPGESQTLLVSGFFDGYPNARYATRVTAIYACDLGG